MLFVCLVDYLMVVWIVFDVKIRCFVGVFVFYLMCLFIVYIFFFYIKEMLIFILKICLLKIIVCIYIMLFG